MPRRTQSQSVRRVQGVPGNDHHAISAFRNLRTEASDARRLRRVIAINSRGLREEEERDGKTSKITSVPACSTTTDLYTPYELASDTYAHRRGPAACACTGGTKRPQRGVASERTSKRWRRTRERQNGRKGGKGGETPPENLSGRRI